MPTNESKLTRHYHKAPAWVTNWIEALEQETQSILALESRVMVSSILQKVRNPPDLEAQRHELAYLRLKEIHGLLESLQGVKEQGDMLNAILKIANLHYMQKAHNSPVWAQAGVATQEVLQGQINNVPLFERSIARAGLKAAIYSPFSCSESAVCSTNVKRLLAQPESQEKAYEQAWDLEIQRFNKVLQEFKGGKR